MNFSDLGIMLPAFIAGLLVLATHVPLGMKVLARGIIFVDLAVAQIAGLGVIVAGMLGLESNVLAVQGTAAASALLGAALLAYAERKFPQVQEAIIGLLFVLAASGGILLMSHDVHAGEHLKDLLVGQILWVGNSQLIATAVLTAVLLALWRVFNQRLGSLGFYALFALAVTASVQLVGVYLVFTSLIVPALATHRMQRRRMVTAFAVGLAGYVAGLLLSMWLDLPTGAAIVWAMATVALALQWIMPSKWKA
ncbi:MAG: metal ABC transporter permease [Sideroxydans sp.]|nr:metal ABC transporter permease [Sideroxydans sp.]